MKMTEKKDKHEIISKMYLNIKKLAYYVWSSDFFLFPDTHVDPHTHTLMQKSKLHITEVSEERRMMKEKYIKRHNGQKLVKFADSKLSAKPKQGKINETRTKKETKY